MFYDEKKYNMGSMKAILSQLIADFQERELPELVARDNVFSEIPGKAAVAIGMRRTGKTFFCYQKMSELMGGGVKRQQLLYLNFEDERLLDFKVRDFQSILDVYYGRFPEHKDLECYFFFDEIQRIDQWEMFIRRLLDTEKARIFLTGSSSKLLSTEIATSLRGRSLSTEIFPFDFKEYLKAKSLFAQPPQQFGSRTAATLRKAISDYLATGGFPEVLHLAPNLRVEVLQGYIDSVILKDVIERHRVGNVIALKHLVSHIMHAPGGKFSVNRFYNTLKSMAVKCTKNSLYEYLDHLLDAYLLYRVPIHSHSEKARMLNPPKLYTVDTLIGLNFHFKTGGGKMRGLTMVKTWCLALALLVFGAGSAAAFWNDGYRYISAADLQKRLEGKETMLLVDIQPADAFGKGHIVGSIETNAYPVKSDEERARLEKVLPILAASQDEVIVVCPGGGSGAKNTVNFFKSKGIDEKRFFILEKGRKGWPYETVAR